MKIRLATRDDLNAVVSLQQKSPGAASWRLSDYELLFEDPGGKILVAEVSPSVPPRVVGFAAFHRLLDEVELRNMAVDPDYRRQGIGRSLLLAGRDRMMAAGVRRVYLEVRASNNAAQALYASLGFAVGYTRKSYYQDPPEDALVLELEFPSTGNDDPGIQERI